MTEAILRLKGKLIYSGDKLGQPEDNEPELYRLYSTDLPRDDVLKEVADYSATLDKRQPIVPGLRDGICLDLRTGDIGTMELLAIDSDVCLKIWSDK